MDLQSSTVQYSTSTLPYRTLPLIALYCTILCYTFPTTKLARQRPSPTQLEIHSFCLISPPRKSPPSIPPPPLLLTPPFSLSYCHTVTCHL
ncbi:hypothetical protein CC80DRAFT_324244 [Byssothecium circinans]|uniref:Uncharacterized protein n=1 Tax=Byssothecium circinans TaxID=147558 RepID=A0A6A5U3L5_9PLEO|nr:hypothetical protein CC80DRAFT_324244 [Byssothecium circinans]